jgi:L-ascorbate metabolism protein UlaG (beta-lactamase superfamily)
MFQQSGARYLVPIHWGTFRLSKEPMDEPMRRLLAAAGQESDRVAIRQIGVAWSLPTMKPLYGSPGRGQAGEVVKEKASK